MTRSANARLAGFTFLVYIAAGVSGLALAGRVEAVTSVLGSFSALVLGVTLYAITHDQDPDLAMLAMTCRVLEAVPGDGRVNAIFFAAGSSVFSWLLLRGQMIPRALAWLGVIASPLLGVLLLVQRAGFLNQGADWSSSLTWVLWLPMLIFEVTFALWLLIKGVAPRGGSGPAALGAA